MGVAAPAHDLYPLHEKGVVCFCFDVLFRNRSPETGPARSGLELCFGAEQVVAAADALVSAFFVVVPVFAGERPFRAFLARNLKLFWGQKLFPLRFALDHLVSHDESLVPHGINLYLSRSRTAGA